MLHQYRLNGYNIVLDVNSGGVHVVDDLTYDLIEQLSPPLEKTCPESVYRTLSQYPKAALDDAYAEVYSLYRDGALYAEDDYAPFADLMVSAPVKAMCLHIAHDCNLRCAYCFASTGDFGGGRKLMDFETGKAAIDFLLAHSAGRKNLEVDFFGGEPLMNFEVVRQIVAYARQQEEKWNKTFRFTITTNGLLLTDDKIDFINREMSNVVLSLDGRKEVNDKLRRCVDGSGSYDLIVDKYRRLVEQRGQRDYYVRGTFTRYNLDFTEDVLHLHDLGFEQISVEPVVGDPSTDYALREEDLPRIYEEYLRLSREIIRTRRAGDFFNFFHFMLDLEQGPCAIKRLRGCGCGNEYLAVTPDGDLYPCHQFVGMEDWKMGSVHDGSLDLEKKARFARTTVYHKEGCKDCWAKFYCSGGCNANHVQYAGDLLKPYSIACALEKKRLECAIMIQAALAE